MNTEWERVNRLFHEAMERSGEERQEFIARASQNDPALQREIQSLIAACEDDDGFLDNSPLGKSLFRQMGGWQRQFIDALKSHAGKGSPRADRLAGQLLDGKYEIEALCGQGGMGAVYRATHVGTGRRVAVKVIAPELAGDSEFIERFRREAKTIGLLRHPNIVNVTDFGVTGDGARTVAYLVMEYLEGQTLAERLKNRRPMPVNETISILSQTCAAMDEAHRLGILHRDLKPENIWLEPLGANGSNVKILDFGIARLQDAFPLNDPDTPPELGERPLRPQPFSITEEETLRLNYTARQMSRFGSLMGTPKYMSPEQCRGERLDKSSDIYSLGVIAYQMLTGEPPFTGTTPELLTRHREAAPAPLREKRRDISAGVDVVVRQALAKDKNDRPATAGAFAFQLQLRSAGNRWIRLQADTLNSQYRWKFLEIALRTQWKGWLASLLLAFATLKLPGMSTTMSVAVFGLLWLVIAAAIISGQNATTAACALFIEQMEGGPDTGVRSIVAAVRRRSRDLARSTFRLIIPALIHEGLSVEEARRRWHMLKSPIRRQIAYTLFRRVLSFAIAVTVAQQILIALAFPLDRGRAFNTPQVFLVAMSNTVFFWLPLALMIWIVAFNLSLKSAVEQFTLYLAARKAGGAIPFEQGASLPDSEAWQVRWLTRWKTYAPTCAAVVLIIGFHLAKFGWMSRRVMDGDLYSVKASHVSGVPVPVWPFKAEFTIYGLVQSSAMTRYLIEKGADVNAPIRLNGPDYVSTPLMIALSNCQVDTARLLIERGANARGTPDSARTPMTVAVSDCPGAIEMLLAAGVDINERTRLGTPLLIAALYQWQIFGQAVFIDPLQAKAMIDRQGDAVKTLIEKGADPNARDGEGRNALMVMSLERFRGDDAEITIRPGGTKESRRLGRRDDKVVESIGETLLNAGCDANAADNKGRTPLIHAVASERLNVVELLLKRGANINAKDHDGLSALDWAKKFGDQEIIKLLSSRIFSF
jgi:serine/threonine protein kinase/ankyrin repeat protein